MFHLCGNRVVRQLSTLCVRPSPTPRYWLFLRRPDNTSWTLTPVILVWVGSSVRSRMMWSVSSLTAVAPFGPLRDVTAQLNARCWPLWPCASSSGRICVGPNSVFAQIIGVIGVTTPIQGHGGYDGQVATCSATVSVLHCTPAGQGSW